MRRQQRAEEHFTRGARLLKANDYAGAMLEADKTLKLDPSHQLAQYMRGMALSELGWFEESLAAFRAVLELDPDDYAVRYRVAFQLLQLHRSEEALTTIDAVVAATPDDYAAHTLRSAILTGIGNWEAALEACDRACELAPDTPALRLNRAIVLRNLGRLDEAIADYDWILSRTAGSDLLATDKGVTLAMAGRLDDALAVLPVSPGTPRSQVWAAAIHWHRGNATLARDLFAQASLALQDPTRTRDESEDPLLRALTATALRYQDQAAAALAELTATGPEASATSPALFALLSAPALEGIEQLRPFMSPLRHGRETGVQK